MQCIVIAGERSRRQRVPEVNLGIGIAASKFRDRRFSDVSRLAAGDENKA